MTEPTEPTEPTEVTTVPATPALARVAGITPDGRIALRIDFADPKGNRTVFYTLDPVAVFPLSDELFRHAFKANPEAGREWSASEAERLALANSAPVGSA